MLQELSKQEVGLDARLGQHGRWFPNIFFGQFAVGHEGAISSIYDLIQAPLILRSQKSGSASAGLGSGKTQCSLFLLSDFLDFGLVLTFPSSCSFCECASPGCAHTSSSSSRNLCLKQEVTEQDADSCMNLQLERFGCVTQAFPPQFPVACATYFKII